MGKYLKELKFRRRKVDQVQIKQFVKLDGKCLLSICAESLSVEDVVHWHNKVMEVERTFRNLYATLSLRPVYQTKEDRICSYDVLACAASGTNDWAGARHDLAPGTRWVRAPSFREFFAQRWPYTMVHRMNKRSVQDIFKTNYFYSHKDTNNRAQLINLQVLRHF